MITTGRSRRATEDDVRRHPGDPARHLADAVEHAGQPAVVVAAAPAARPAATSTSSTRTRRCPGLADVAAFTSPVPVVLTYHAGSLVKGGHPVDPLLRAYERHVLPRVFARCRRAGRGLARRRCRTRPAAPTWSRRASTATCSPRRRPRPSVSRGSSTSAGSSAPRAGRACRSSSRRWCGCASWCPASASSRRATATTSLPLQKLAAELGVADLVDWAGQVAHDELPRVLPAAPA